MSDRQAGSRLWQIRSPTTQALFVGSLEEMAKEIARLHRETGMQHAAREIE